MALVLAVADAGLLGNEVGGSTVSIASWLLTLHGTDVG
jgi:hypothetical protein